MLTMRGSPVFVSFPDSSIVMVFLHQSNVTCPQVRGMTLPVRMPVYEQLVTTSLAWGEGASPVPERILPTHESLFVGVVL